MNKLENTYDVQKAIIAQAKYCNDNDVPHFAPYSGICYKCHRNIYEEVEHTNRYTGNKCTTGITVDMASTELVTGCPHCHISYAIR